MDLPVRQPLLNIAASYIGATTLGPGWRAVVWVQGCPFCCPGCIAPEWIPQKPARLVQPSDLVAELLSDRRVDGLTFSGGEPLRQAAGLAEVARLARLQRDLSVICFTGYTLEELQFPPLPEMGEGSGARNASKVRALLTEVDVLIAGSYVAELNDNRGLRGSSNQYIHYLTNRLKDCDFETQPRQVHIHMADGYAILVGVPSQQVESSFQRAIQQAQRPLALAKEKNNAAK